MGVTFWGNFASRTLLVPFHWCGMCYAHHAVDMPDRGSYWGPGLNNPFCSTWPRQGRPSVRWSRRAMIPSALLRRAVVAALAALAITWPAMLSARAQTQPREGLSRTSPSGSYLAARHAGGQRDAAAAASYYLSLIHI